MSCVNGALTIWSTTGPLSSSAPVGIESIEHILKLQIFIAVNSNLLP